MIHHIVLRDTGIPRASLYEIINDGLDVWHKRTYPLGDREVIIQRVKGSDYWKCYRLYDDSEPSPLIARLSVYHSFRKLTAVDGVTIRLTVHGVYDRYPTIRHVIKFMQRFIRVEDPRWVQVVDVDFCEDIPWTSEVAYQSIVLDRRFKYLPWDEGSHSYGTWRSGKIKSYDKRRERAHKNMPWPDSARRHRVEVGCPLPRLRRVLGLKEGATVTLLDLTNLMYEGKHPFYMVRCFIMRRDPPRKYQARFIKMRKSLPESGMKSIYDYTRISRLNSWLESFPLCNELALANRIWLRRFLGPLERYHFKMIGFDPSNFCGT